LVEKIKPPSPAKLRQTHLSLKLCLTGFDYVTPLLKEFHHKTSGFPDTDQGQRTLVRQKRCATM
jgi:hypothetical protein